MVDVSGRWTWCGESVAGRPRVPPALFERPERMPAAASLREGGVTCAGPRAWRGSGGGDMLGKTT